MDFTRGLDARRLRGKVFYVRRFKDYGGLVAVLGAVILIYSFLPLGSALEIGDDEGFELIKGLMCSRGFHLYTQIWNDQPPVSTVVLSSAFKVFGARILVARLLAAAYGLLLVTVFYALVRQRSGTRAALFASFFLVAAPATLILMVSVMLEMPAFALAMTAVWPLFRWDGRRSRWWLLGSGAIMGAALQTKFTAALVAPAILIEFLLLCRDRRLGWRQIVLQGAYWVLGFAAALSVIGLTWGKGSLATSWKSHTTSQAAPGLPLPNDYKFDFKISLNHYEAVAGAAACIALAARRKRLREVAFPVALAATVFPVHLLHRPWWDYYYLHLALPLSWLAGWTLNEMVLEIQARSKGAAGFAFLARWPVLVLCGLTALAVAKSERRLEGTMKFIRARPRTEDNPIVQTMKHYPARAPLVYSESGIYAFHAGLNVIPDLAIIMPKRFWSGQITANEIIDSCKREHAELIVIRSRSLNQEWREFLNSACTLAARDKYSQLYRLK